MIDFPRVDVVEQAREYAVQFLKNDWYIFLDPDEVLSSNANEVIGRAILSDNSLGQIFIPWIFHFKGKVLKTTIWSFYQNPDQYKGVVCCKSKTRWSDQVHGSVSVINGAKALRLSYKDAYINHFWVTQSHK